MQNGITIELDDKAVKEWLTAVTDRSKQLNRSLPSTLAWGGRKIAQSLGARTPQAKKLRPVIENPHPDAKTDARRAKFGVMRYRANGTKVFVPIYRTGEFGTIRFQNKKTATWFVTDKATGRTTRELATGTKPDQIPGIMQSKKRVIGRRGFAKKSWRFLGMRMGRGGNITIDSIPDLGSVAWAGDKLQLTVTNKVRYMSDILMGGAESAINSAIKAATDGMVYQTRNDIRKRVFGK